MKRITILQKLKALMATLKKMRVELMVRKVCEEEGLSEEESDKIVKVLKCESGLNVNAINRNKNNTTDFGICQFNDFHYWKQEKIIHPDVALNNPEEAVKVMINMYKKGRLKDWICYRHRLYKRF